MAKQKMNDGQKKGSNKGHGKQNPVNLGSVTENIKLTEIGRSRTRKVARLLDARRHDERQNGTFHARVNEGRSTDIMAALAGEVGSYAYPGGNEPSVHFSVTKEVRKFDAVAVIRFEAVQKGHELAGTTFDPRIYVPCYYIMKYGFRFQSNSKDQLVAATQKTIVYYLAEAIGLPPLESETTAVEQGDPIFQNASTDHKSMLGEKNGLYLVPSAQGDVVVEVFTRDDKAFIKVAASKNVEIELSRVYLPVYLLFKDRLDQVTTDEVYEKQFALYLFIRTELGDMINNTKPVKRQRSFWQPVAPVLREVPNEEVMPAPIVAKPAPVRPPRPEVEEVDVTGHQPLTALQFWDKNQEGIFHHGEGGVYAYFRRERIAGVPSFVLIVAEEGHSLVPCLVKHDTVHVHLQDLSASDRPYDGDLSNLKNARECVRQYLRRVGFSLGLRPKQQMVNTATAETNKSA